jgi:hypothetical protein
MGTHSVQVWRVALDNVAAWTAAEFLLSSLVDYQVMANDGGFADREQTYNFLMAWRLASPAVRLRKVNGPVPITEGRLSPQQWSNLFSKLSAVAAAEVIMENYLNDPACGYTDGVAMLSSALTAWGDVQVSQHKLRGRSPSSPTASP